MKRKLAYWIIVVCFLPSLSLAATVTRILDGDTLEVTEDNKTLRVRLIDIDGVRLEKGNYPTLSAFFAQMATD